MAITSARMQQKRGEEFNFDPDKMLPGEWAVSLDTKYVRMCFSPGVCVRMATYEAFEADMAQITAILEEAKTVQEAVEKINLEISDKLNAVIEYSEQTKQYRDEAEQFRNEAFSATPDGYEKLVKNVTENTVKIDTIIEKAELNIKNTASGENIHLTDSANSKVVEFGLYGKATQDGEPTPDNPIEITVSGSDGSVEVVSCGKNLVSGEYINMYAHMNVVQKFEISSSVQASLIRVKPNTTYLLGRKGGSQYSTVGFSEKEPVLGESYLSAIHVGSRETMSVTTPSNVNYMLWYHHLLNDPATEIFCYETTETSAEYEPYKETTSTVSTPNGLCGIPVSSGGNYTDINGQQWICDEIVKYADGSGKRIQRIASVDMGTLGWVKQDKYPTIMSVRIKNMKSGLSSGLICQCYIYNSKNFTYAQSDNWENLTIGKNNQDSYVYLKDISYTDVETFKTDMSGKMLYYELAEPIITDLSAEEIAEIEKLHTFYPITNISNDADCGMSITYLADSKLYIDNQLAIQKAQQEEALATMLLLMPEEVQASMIENDTNNLLNESEV